MTRQAEKYFLNLAGEFYVAAELQRRRIAAAVTYGNAKRADVVAISDTGRAVVIEVKSTPGSQWVVGNHLPESSSRVWVFVHIPQSPSDWPSFYVMTQSDLHDILAPRDKEYRERYFVKHGQEYGDRPGVYNLSRIQAAPYKDAWQIILQLLSSQSKEQ